MILFKEFQLKKELLMVLRENHVVENDSKSEMIFYWGLKLKNFFQTAKKLLKSVVTEPQSPDVYSECMNKLRECTRLIHFLLNHTTKNESALLNSIELSPDNVQVFYFQFDDPK